MFSELNNYKNNGHFFFKPGDSLAEITKEVPDLPGVYYIIRLAHGNVELVYIGKSGSVEQNGRFKKQGLRGRLNNKQEGMRRQEFFDMKCPEENIDALDIYWFVTFDEKHHDLPGYVEGMIMQVFYEVHACLPAWNNSF